MKQAQASSQGRQFGSKLACVGALLALATTCLATRAVQNLGTGWRFHKGDVPGAEAANFDDSQWTAVTVPHTWNAEDGARGGGYYRGLGWYRLPLNVSPAHLHKRLFLRFGAASLVANVYLNGQKVGEHRGGFGAFVIPISRFAKVGDNELAVRVDNTRNPDVTPLSGDFTVYGGLYRNVELLALDEVGISPLDDGGPGVYLTSTVNGGEADVDVRAVVLGSAGPVTVRTVVEDPRGHEVARGDSTGCLADDQPQDLHATVHIAKPHLWDGVHDPYLYHARIQVFRRRKVLDETVQPLGIRMFRVDPEQGLILNGRPYDLHGVNIHQGRPSVGWAVTPGMQDEDYAMVKELGCTGVRMPHYQHAPHEYELCDRLGLAVWAELALVNQVSNTPEFRANAEEQLRELIKQNYNHPSILFWSLYNELWLDKKSEPGMRQIETLNALAKRLDPNRLTTGAAVTSLGNWLTDVGDVPSVNKYWGWYGGAPTIWPDEMDKLRKQSPDRGFGISEYGAGASVIQHEVPPRQPAPSSKWHPEEWQSLVHEYAWPALADRPYVWNKFIWVMFDFGSSGRNEGDHPGINDKGLVTGDRKTRKDAFFYYKAQWTKSPFVHLNSSRFNPRQAGTTEVRVYSNETRVLLTLDGKSLGEMTRIAPGVFVMAGVELPPGDHTVEAQGDRGARDWARWHVVEGQIKSE
jgi:beta-galactosidase